MAVFDGREVPDNPLVAMNIEASQLLPLPSGRWTFAYPNVGVDGDGTLHMLWGEPVAGEGARRARDWPGAITTVWAADYRAERGWSAPQRLIDATLAEWENSLVADMQRSDRGDLAVSLVATQRAGRDSPVLLARLGTRWYVVPIATTAGAPAMLYTAAAPSDGVVHLAAIEASDPRTDTPARVSYRRWNVQANTWSPAARVATMHPGERAAEVRVVASDDSDALIVWSARGAGHPARLYAASSRDGGRHWSVPDSLDVAPEILTTKIVRGPNDGTAHLLYEHTTAAGDDGHVDHVVWSNGWSRPSHLFADLHSLSPAIGVLADGRVAMTFLGRASPTANPETYRSYLSVFGGMPARVSH